MNKGDNITQIIALSVVLILLLYLAIKHLRFIGSGEYVMTTTVSESVDEERTLFANSILSIAEYKLSSYVQTPPNLATSPDGQRYYFRVVTTYGHLMIVFNWQKHKVYLQYGYHTDNESGMMQCRLRERHNTVNEVKLAKFLDRVARNELELLAGSTEGKQAILNLLQQSLSQNGEEENGGE